MGARSFLESISKFKSLPDSTALPNLTGILTRPKLIDPDQIERIS
jgi:hypothetical protein